METLESGESFTEKERRVQIALSGIGYDVQEKFNKAKMARNATEKKWLDAVAAWRGEYTETERARINTLKAKNPYASDIYIKITKTKVQAAYGQLIEVLFSEKRFPIRVEPTPKPEGIAEVAHLEPQPSEVYGFPGDGKEITPGATSQSILGGLYEKYKAVKDKLVKGPSHDRSKVPEIYPAKESAEALDKVIQDQLIEGDVETELRNAALENVLLGTMVFKGPFTNSQVIHAWVANEESGELTYEPKFKEVPESKYVSCWNFYPEPNARCLQDASYVIERHVLSRSEFRKLKLQPAFNKKLIDQILRSAPRGEKEYWENAIQDSSVDGNEEERYKVLEYWGYLELEQLEALVDAKLVDKDELAKFVDLAQVNVWVCQGEVIRLVLNPFIPARIPYYTVPYEEHPWQIWGIGIAENMRDTQNLMNGHMRMGIDNLMLSGNVILEVNENQLQPGQDMLLYPGKIFRKQGGAPGQSIYGITIPNTTQQHLMMYDKARQLSDESTGQPSYSHGSTGATGTTRTASGMSMLMSAANLSIKTVIRNFDHYLLKPLGEAYYHWNMQFNEDVPEIRGDIQIMAGGTAPLMQKEVQSQRLMSFMQITTSNPLTAPYINVPYLVKEIAQTMELDADKLVNSPEEAAIFAQAMGQMQTSMSPEEQAMQGQAPGGLNPQDQTGGGGGNIGVGSAPPPGTDQFSANKG